MGNKSLVTDMSNRIYKGVLLAQGFQRTTHCHIVCLAGDKGIHAIQCTPEFMETLFPWTFAKPEYDYDAYWGRLRGVIYDLRVYTPYGFNDNVIELRDAEGLFTYTIDLSEEIL